MRKIKFALVCISVFALAAAVGSLIPLGVGESPVSILVEAQATEVMNADTPFLKNLPNGLKLPSNDVEALLLREYGSIFVARSGAKPPTRIVFRDHEEVADFQSSVSVKAEMINGISVELQSAAMKALKSAISDAKKEGLAISPRSSDSSRRDYQHTVRLWASRVNPGLTYWTAKGKISKTEAARIRKLTPFEQVPVILSLEKRKIFFAKSLDKSIIYSVAPPGASQHLSMLALDVKEFDNARVRAILGEHGWYQTVTSDLPHFTFLGEKEVKLPKLGLKRVENSRRTFWIPDIDEL